MTDVKSKLHGGVSAKKKKGAERLKIVLDEVKKRGIVGAGELAEATGLDQKTLNRYLDYLQGKGLIQVKRRLLREAEISAIGAGIVKRKVRSEAKAEAAAPEAAAAPGAAQSKPAPAEAAGEGEYKHIAPVGVAVAPPGPAVAETRPAVPAEAPKPEAAPAEAAPEALEFEAAPAEAAPVEAAPVASAQAPVEVAPPEAPEASPEAIEDEELEAEAAELKAAELKAAAEADIAGPESKGEEGKMVVGGAKVKPGTEKEFMEVCKSLTTDFVGAMRLYGEADEESYTAGLLIDKGNIVAVSFEHMDTIEITYGDNAMREMQMLFVGTKGDLEIFEMTEDDLNESLRPNVNYMLSSPIMLSTLKIKIKSRLKPQPPPKEKKGFFSGVKGMFSKGEAMHKDERKAMMEEMRKRKVEKISGGFNLVDFARNLKIDPTKAKRFKELRKKRAKGGPDAALTPAGISEKKAARLEELKAKKAGGGVKSVISAVAGGATKQGRRDELRQTGDVTPLNLEKEEKKPKKRVQEGKKIMTNIDKLYEFVQSSGRVKINDALVHKLKVSKTQIEEWAMILEEHNLLELRYPTIGEPEMIGLNAGKTVKKEGSDGKRKKGRDN